jgi:hypothetical protein
MHSQHQIGRSDVQGNTRNERGGAPVTSYRVLREITIRNASFLSADRSETPNGWRFLSTIDKCLPRCRVEPYTFHDSRLYAGH